MLILTQLNDRLSQHLPYNAAPNVGLWLSPAEQVGYMLSCVRRGYAKSLVRRRGKPPPYSACKHKRSFRVLCIFHLRKDYYSTAAQALHNGISALSRNELSKQFRIMHS